jgi:hypothetical protein
MTRKLPYSCLTVNVSSRRRLRRRAGPYSFPGARFRAIAAASPQPESPPR